MRDFVKQLIGDDNEEFLFNSKAPYELTVRRVLRGISFEKAMEKWYVDSSINATKVSEGAIRCKKCGSRRIMSHSLQTRSADESETFFHFCTECSTRWKT